MADVLATWSDSLIVVVKVEECEMNNVSVIVIVLFMFLMWLLPQTCTDSFEDSSFYYDLLKIRVLFFECILSSNTAPLFHFRMMQFLMVQTAATWHMLS